MRSWNQLAPHAGLQVSLHKRHNVAAARRVASNARAMLGANGIIDTNKVGACQHRAPCLC